MNIAILNCVQITKTMSQTGPTLVIPRPARESSQQCALFYIYQFDVYRITESISWHSTRNQDFVIGSNLAIVVWWKDLWFMTGGLPARDPIPPKFGDVYEITESNASQSTRNLDFVLWSDPVGVVWWRFFFLLSPLKPDLFGRIRNELDSPNVVGHLPSTPSPAITFPQGARKWAVVGKDNWKPYRAYLLSDLRTLPPLRRNQPPQTGLCHC
ncbi:hypothetical protein AVEN_41037-1 [Araneus ventricosus]|uniref:Uncharacterized protein n=1 Tax=Araneus ventricosus TaxID=182803 RepID=A0A4Y2CJW3_ARAVE|nr:hypothetical protein AVEN_41037-1 [Araneus ventricosus]